MHQSQIHSLKATATGHRPNPGSRRLSSLRGMSGTVTLEGGDRMFKIVDVASGASVGSVGFWTKEWRDNQAYEVGWMVVPEFQGRGIAVAATAQAIELARRDDKHRFMHAFPNVDNAPSNAICRKLGFELLEACEFEFPKGHLMTCNDWRLDLRA